MNKLDNVNDSISRERFFSTISGVISDRPPFFFRAIPEICDRYQEELDIDREIDLLKFFHSDAIHILPKYKPEFIEDPDEKGFYKDLFGNIMRKTRRNDLTSVVTVKPVLQNENKLSSIENVKWPGINILDIEESISEAKEAHDAGFMVYGGIWSSIFTVARNLVGEESFLYKLIDSPDFIKELIRRLTDNFVGLNDYYLSKCGKYIDIYYFGSDFGTQLSMFISPEMFQEYFKEQIRKIITEAKNYVLNVMFHTCGAVVPIIEDLIECGVDILDPIQVSASGMSAKELKSRFGGRLSFHGGISTQTGILQKGAEAVKWETKKIIHELGPSRFIVAPDQHIIENVPVETILGIVDGVNNCD